jgi:hypothetical protein
MNLAFYTYFYGSDNNVAFKIPDIPSLKYNCYYYTNNKTMIEKIKETKWIGIFIDKQTIDKSTETNETNESNMFGKHVKTCPHEYEELKDYDYLCFFDSKVKNVSETGIERYITQYFIEQNYAMVIREHWYINSTILNRNVSIWDEFIESMYQKRYILESEQFCTYIHKQLSNGFQKTTKDHCACNYIIRNMKHEKINEINTTWYEHIQECGVQDQLSFFFVKQLFEGYILSSNNMPFK